jgi:transaldolase
MKRSDLRIKLFADGANLKDMLALAQQSYIKGFTTNPTLMRKAGITDYLRFAKEATANIVDRPISFEVFSDELSEMDRQARLISGWGKNVYVKIPVTNTRGESTQSLVHALSHDGIKLNVTAILTLPQVESMAKALAGGAPSIVSVFAGRIADSGIDPVPMMVEALGVLGSECPPAELLWASPREVLNVVQADQIGCHIVTATHDILDKLGRLGKDLDQFSLETVQMFYNDAQAAGFTL